MTREERIEMFKEKNKFIQKLELILTTPCPKGISVQSIDYEVWEREIDDILRYQEVIVITFEGGILPISVSGNSNSANLRVVSNNIDGGDYSFSPTYMRIKDLWTKLDLN